MGGRVAGWVVGKLESNAKLNSGLRLRLKLKLELSLEIGLKIDVFKGILRTKQPINGPKNYLTKTFNLRCSEYFKTLFIYMSICSWFVSFSVDTPKRLRSANHFCLF